MSERQSGAEALRYEPSKVSWVAGEFARQPPPWAATIGFYCLVLAATCGLVYSIIAKYPVSIGTAGSVATKDPSLPVVSTVNAKVIELFVKDDETIAAGEPLMRTDVELTRAQLDKILAGVKELSRVIKQDQQGRCGAACLRPLDRIASDGFGVELKGDLLDKVVRIREGAQQYLAALETRGKGSTMLAEHRRRLAVAREKLAKIQASESKAYLKVQIEELKSTIGQTSGQIAERINGDARAVESNRERLAIQLGKFETEVKSYFESTMITAPRAGTVTQLSVKGAGQQLFAGQALLDLIPTDSEYVAEIGIANQDIAKVKVGMRVKMNVAALPEREYGSLWGRIEQIAAAPVGAAAPATGGAAPAASGAQDMYKARVALEGQSLGKDGVDHPLRFGMKLDGTIIVKEERLIVLGAKRIFNVKDELLGSSL